MTSSTEGVEFCDPIILESIIVHNRGLTGCCLICSLYRTTWEITEIRGYIAASNGIVGLQYNNRYGLMNKSKNKPLL